MLDYANSRTKAESGIGADADLLVLAGAPGVGEAEVAQYLKAVLAREPLALTTGREVPEAVYAALAHKRFCALSRGRAGRYREAILATLARAIRRDEPLEFWYDIGPGYHASLRPGALPLSFAVGLGEYLMLSQVASFAESVALLHRPGVRFRLVIDNLCALHSNGIAIERTAGYCGQLRLMIEEVGLAERVRLFVESEELEPEEYSALLRETLNRSVAAQVLPAELDNVARFLGRHCSQAEALERIGLYERATLVTERLLARAVRGVRLTQRPTADTLGFRSFPGGDARIQCGELALRQAPNGSLTPILLTSRNVDFYDYARLELPASSLIRHVGIARRAQPK